MVARSMRELLDGAARSSAESTARQALQRSGAAARSELPEEQPLESAPLYQKFRGLGFRMRELSALLKGSGAAATAMGAARTQRSSGKDFNGRSHGHGHADQDVVSEVKQAYVLLRTELLLPFVKDSCLAVLNAGKAAGDSKQGSPRAAAINKSSSGDLASVTATTPAPHATLCPGIRHTFSTLLRITQLEQQLFDSLFRPSNPASATVATAAGASDDAVGSQRSPRASMSASSLATASASTSDGADASSSSEVFSIVESVCNAAGDLLRPLIIRESDVDELCRIVTTLVSELVDSHRCYCCDALAGS
jgi:hypothetical protein